MTTPLRVVLDTNVVLSALVRVLAYPKFRLSKPDQEELLADYLPYAQTVRIPQSPPTVPECRGPLDVPFLHLAVAGKAQVLVSGDKNLLGLSEELEKASGCIIVTKDAFFHL